MWAADYFKIAVSPLSSNCSNTVRELVDPLHVLRVHDTKQLVLGRRQKRSSAYMHVLSWV